MSDLGQIYSKLETIDSKVDELLQWKAGHDKGHETIDRDITEVRDVLFENPGLKSRVERLWNCKNSISRWGDFWTYILKVIIAVSVLGVIGWLLGLYRSINVNVP